MRRPLLLVMFALLFLHTVRAQSIKLPPQAIRKIDSLITKELKNGAYPGASFAVGDRSGVIYAHAYGYFDYSHRQPVTENSLYDVASCTKVLSTTFALMRLYDQQKIRIDQPLSHFLPQYAGTTLGTVTLEELLTHTSGIRPNVFYPLLVHNVSGERLFSSKPSESYPFLVEKNLYMARDVMFDSLYTCTLPTPGYRLLCEGRYLNPAIDTVITREILRSFNPQKRGTYSYCDANFYLLKQVVESVSGEELATFTRNLYAELDCHRIGYLPLEWAKRDDIVPTEVDYLLRRDTVRGLPHDELAAMAGGVGGNAGLFATPEGISRFCEMILAGGSYKGRQIIQSETISRFTSSPLIGQGIYRGLGFDKRSTASGALGGDQNCGHTGFTGTIFWINREKGYYMVFLSNSVHPSRTNNRLTNSGLRTKLWETISGYL